MKSIKDLLFGKKIHLEDPIIGVLETRIRSRKTSVKRTWIGSHLIGNQGIETVFILEGNINGPFVKQLESAHAVVKELDLIIEEIDTYIQAEHSDDSRFQNWKEEFYFEALVPYDEELNQFEIAFGHIDSRDTRSLGCFWTNGIISEISVRS